MGWRDITIKVHIKEEDFWSEVMGAAWEVYPWWQSVTYLDGADWDKMGKIRVDHDDPEDLKQGVIADKVIDIDRLFDAHRELESDITEDFDSVSSDALMQQAVYGEVLFG